MQAQQILQQPAGLEYLDLDQLDNQGFQKGAARFPFRGYQVKIAEQLLPATTAVLALKHGFCSMPMQARAKLKSFPFLVIVMIPNIEVLRSTK